MNKTFGDLPCVTGIEDDIVVYGYNSDFSDPDENLRAALQHARETGLRFNLDNADSGAPKFPLLAMS